MAPKTRLAFDARITSIGVKPAKDIAAKGKFELGLTIEQPDPPRAPAVPWEFAAGPERARWKPRPDNRRKPKESDEEYGVRSGEVIKEQARYDDARAAFDTASAEYQAKLTGYRQKVMAYAQLVGIASVFGNQAVNVVVTPANQDLIPGFAAELTEPAEKELLQAVGTEAP